MNVVLVGYRGTGKSEVARLLGEALGLQVVSLDAELVKKAGKPIPEVVAERGLARISRSGRRDRSHASRPAMARSSIAVAV